MKDRTDDGDTGSVRHRDADARGGVGGREGIGAGHSITDPDAIRLALVGGVRPTLAQLRAAAELERANRPTHLQYLVWTLALASKQPISEIGGLTFREAPYFGELLKTGKVPRG